MKLNIEIDFDEIWVDDSTIGDHIRDEIVTAIKKELRKNPAYKKFVEESVSSALRIISNTEVIK